MKSLFETFLFRKFSKFHLRILRKRNGRGSQVGSWRLLLCTLSDFPIAHLFERKSKNNIPQIYNMHISFFIFIRILICKIDLQSQNMTLKSA